MAEKPSPRPKDKLDKEQSARFIETARTLDADESGAMFEKAVGVIVQRKPDSGDKGQP